MPPTTTIVKTAPLVPISHQPTARGATPSAAAAATAEVEDDVPPGEASVAQSRRGCGFCSSSVGRQSGRAAAGRPSRLRAALAKLRAAIAVSLHLGDRNRIFYDRAAEIGRTVIDRVLAHSIDPHSVINVNIPRTESADASMPPVHVVEMNTAAGGSTYEHRTSPAGRNYYWACGSGLEFDHTAKGSDVEALLERAVTVTPLSYDLTDHARMNSWRERLQAPCDGEP